MNKLKKSILALTFLGRVKKDTLTYPSEFILPNTNELKTKIINQISTTEDVARSLSPINKNDQDIFSPTGKLNKIVPLNEENLEINYSSLLSLEKFEREVNLTENDSRYFRSESELDDDTPLENKESPSLFCIEEEDEIIDKNEENFQPNDSKNLKNTPIDIIQTPFVPELDSNDQKTNKLILEDEKSYNEEQVNPLEDEEGLNPRDLTKLRKEDRYKNNQLVLYPDDGFKRFWNIIMSFLIMYVCLIMPYRVCFIEDDSIFSDLDYFTDSCFYLDLLVNFVSVYHDLDDELVVDNRKIILHYLTSWFFFDFVAIFPFDAILMNDKYNTLIRVARLPKLYRLIRVTKLIRMLKLFKDKRKLMNPLLQMGAGSQRLIFSIISIIIFCHIACCFWYLTAILDDSLINWVDQFGYRDSSNFDCYIASFYWVTSTVVTVGYGDIVPVNTLERIVTIVFMFVGVVFYSFTIGSLSSLLSEFDAKNSVFDEKVNTLTQIQRKYVFDDNLFLRIKKALKYGHLKTDQDKENFLNELPSNLRTELSFFMHKSIVVSIEFFKNRSERFIAYIGPLLKPMKIGKNEVVASQGDYANEMFFIKSGKVAIVIQQYNNFKFMNISEGYYFGEVDLLFGETRKFTYLAETDLELLSISKKQFTKIFFHEFLSIGSELYKNGLKRRIRNNKLFREALEYCKARSLEQKTRKASKTESFIINEERYSKKTSFLNEELNSYEMSDSVMNKEKNSNNDKEIFENYEEDYVKSFKTVNKNINKEILTTANNQQKGTGKLKNIISGLIQTKRTLKDEIDDLMINNGKKTKFESENLENIQKKMVNLNQNFIDLLNRLSIAKSHLGKNLIQKLENLLYEEKLSKSNKVSISEPKKSLNSNSHFKKNVSIKISNPITSLDKILENEKLTNLNRKNTTFFRRTSTSIDYKPQNKIKSLKETVPATTGWNFLRKNRSKSLIKK